jgi:hypothetical protein
VNGASADGTLKPVGPSAAHDDPPAGVWVTLDGQRVIELRGSAGSQPPAGLAARTSRELLVLARDNTVDPGQLVVEEDPPCWMVAERQTDGETVPRLAVDERSSTTQLAPVAMIC